ncbi:MAG: hypothetical protein EZS28_019792 [Streblomastix strix]|uniref:Uncharacterized protein n=1 Tax=Streblomastix strix TaxID=222440 RepID=A0A5J4VQC4_9EUKA|nr:MAG: hypothetical protein EZS28_019792 [Streblomastix strix]
MRRQLEQIEHELSDTVERFESREPRPQDLSTIASLETAVAEKDRLLMRLQEENKFYKLELHNREDNYNKKFQRQTTVGSVLNQTSQFGNQTLPYLPMRSPSPSTNTESRNRSSINSSYSSPSLSSSISKSNSHTQLQSQSHIHTHTHSNTPPMSPNRDQISRDGSRERINKEKSGDKEKIISINSNKRVGSAIALRSSHNQLSQSISLASNSANGNRLPQIISKGKK